jgi:hypothetical protein
LWAKDLAARTDHRRSQKPPVPLPTYPEIHAEYPGSVHGRPRIAAWTGILLAEDAAASSSALNSRPAGEVRSHRNRGVERKAALGDVHPADPGASPYDCASYRQYDTAAGRLRAWAWTTGVGASCDKHRAGAGGHGPIDRTADYRIHEYRSTDVRHLETHYSWPCSFPVRVGLDAYHCAAGDLFGPWHEIHG